jgi:recombination protein RecT
MAAQDGVLPDGREGAIAPYGESADGKRVAEIATWMPMIEGLRKKARNSGEIKNWEVHVVRARDHFRFALGDDAFIEHEPYFGIDEPGDIIGAYSIATLADGTKSRDVMTIRDIVKIRAKSKAKNGPWGDPTFFPEMCKKTVARRHYKQLPHSAGLDKMIERDDREFDLDHRSEEQIEARRQRRLGSVSASFDAFASAGSGPIIDHEAGQTAAEAAEDWGDDAQNNQPDDDQPQSQADQDVTDRTSAPKPPAKPTPADTTKPKPQAQEDQQSETQSDAVDTAADQQDDAGNAGEDDGSDRPWPPGETPTNTAEYGRYLETKLSGFVKPGDVKPWFVSKDEAALRKQCGVDDALNKTFQTQAIARINELSKK